jgi:hypothetical protein
MLIESIRMAEQNLASTKADPEETNAALAFCEIAVSIPPAWFTLEERIMVKETIDALYGDALKFIIDINGGHVSFVNKCNNLCHGRSLESFVDVMMRQHMAEFGSVA